MPSRAELERVAKESRAVLEKRAEQIRNGVDPDAMPEEPPVPLQAPPADDEVPEPQRESIEAPPAPEPPPRTNGVDPDRENDPGYLRHLVATERGRREALERQMDSRLKDRETFFNDRMRELNEQLVAAREEAAKAKAKTAGVDEEQELRTVPLTDLGYSQAFIEEQGEETLRQHLIAQARIARRRQPTATTAPPQQDSMLTARLAQLEKERATERNARFLSEVKATVPNWQELQRHATFAAWVSARDPLLGTTRDEALKAAQARGDSEQAAAILQRFSATVTAPARQQTVTPPTVGQGGPAPPPVKLKLSAWTKLGNDFARRRISEKDYMAQESKFRAAQASGNIDWSA